MDTKVNKADLLEVLNRNREQHQAIFEEAVEGFQKRAEELLKKEIERIKTGSKEAVRVSLPAPVNQIKDYDRAIKMMIMNLDDEIVLNEREFAEYVMDDWDWKFGFLTSNSAYSDTAARLSQS